MVTEEIVMVIVHREKVVRTERIVRIISVATVRMERTAKTTAIEETVMAIVSKVKIVPVMVIEETVTVIVHRVRVVRMERTVKIISVLRVVDFQKTVSLIRIRIKIHLMIESLLPVAEILRVEKRAA